MAIYCIWSGGDGTQTNTTQTAGTLDWSKADTSVANLIAYDAAAFTTSGNTIYFADDHNDPNKAAHWTLTGPTSGLPVILISADRTLSTPTVKTGTGNQLSSLGGGYDLTLDGSFALYEMRMASGRNLKFDADNDEVTILASCTLAPAADQYVFFGTGSSAAIGKVEITDAVIDLTYDGTSNRSNAVIQHALTRCAIKGMTFVNAGYRTGTIFYGSPNCHALSVTGLDASPFTNATACEIIGSGASGTIEMSNIKTAATWTFHPATPTPQPSCLLTATTIGPADAPTALYAVGFAGTCISSTDIYRTGGATIEGVACSWLITTTSSCGEHSPFYTPWRYGTLSSTGSKTFDVFITNDTADLTDAEIWLEVEYKSESTEAIWALATDQRATITTTAAAQTDDTTSTWNGSGPSFTYKQKLSVTATVNQVGQYRVRVAVGKTSVAGSRYLYIDPAVTVS